MKATHARPRPARRRAVRAFILTFWITAVVLAGAWAGLVADVRTRRVCDGNRAESVYTRLSEAIQPPLPAESGAAAPEPDDPGPQGWLPYPLRFLLAFGEALEETPRHPDAVPVMAG